MFSPVTGGTTYLSIVGNHEIDWYTGDTLYTLPATTGNQKPDTDSGGECGIPTLTLYPEPAPATIDQPWWSYDIGLIHFVGISSEHNFSTGSPQYLWLENDLKSVDRTITPWVLFGSHRAMYLNSDYGGPVTSDLNVSALLIEYIEPLLWKYRVNIGFYGHNHVVQRTSAVLNKKVIQRSEVVTNDKGQLVNTFRNPQATVHFVVGTGGAGFTKNAVSPWPEWNEQVFYLWGYAIATAESASTLTWTWYNNTDDAVMYRVVMTQCDPTQPWDLNSTITCDETGNDSSDNNGNVAVIVTLCVLIPLALLLIILVGVHKYYKDKNLRRSEEVEAFIEGNKKEFSSTEYRSMQ